MTSAFRGPATSVTSRSTIKRHPDYRGSPNLISFAVEQGWYDPKSGAPFNVNKVYGDGKMRHEAVVMMEERLRKLGGKIRIEDVIAAVRTTEVTRDSAGYGQVAHLRKASRTRLWACSGWQPPHP